MWWIPIGLIIVALMIFVWKSLAEKSNANTLINFFQYGRGFKKRSFFATLVASNSSLSAAVYLIIVYGYFYGLGIFPWILSFWILTQAASVFTIKKVENLTKGGFISRHGTLHEFLGMVYNSSKVRIIAGSLSTITFIGLVATELVLGYEIFRALIPSSMQILGFELEPLIFLFILAGAAFYYTSRSGFRAVVATDKIQLVIILLLIFSVLGVMSLNFHGFVEGYESHFAPLLDIQNSIFNASGEGIASFMFFFVFMNVIFWGMWWPSSFPSGCFRSKRSTRI